MGLRQYRGTVKLSTLVPVLGKDLFADVPVLRRFGMHQAASHWEWWCLYGGILLSYPAQRSVKVLRILHVARDFPMIFE
jgi:hypothetical protein